MLNIYRLNITTEERLLLIQPTWHEVQRATINSILLE
jgi:hypothetical protein